MSLTTTLAACNANPALNGPDGASDLPSSLDDAIRYALSFIAQLRDGAAMPLGSIIMMPTTTAPTGFLKLNGALVSRTTYANLFAFASSLGLVSEATWNAGQFGSFSVGDGSTTFRLPDLRGMFIRGLDESRGIDSGRALGVWQDQQLLSHSHTINISDPSHAHSIADPGHSHSVNDPGHAHSYTVTNLTGITANTGLVGNLPSGQAGAGTTGSGTGISIAASGTGIGIYGSYTGISASATAAGGAEQHPRNLAYPFYIRY